MLNNKRGQFFMSINGLMCRICVWRVDSKGRDSLCAVLLFRRVKRRVEKWNEPSVFINVKYIWRVGFFSLLFFFFRTWIIKIMLYVEYFHQEKERGGRLFAFFFFDGLETEQLFCVSFFHDEYPNGSNFVEENIMSVEVNCNHANEKAF